MLLNEALIGILIHVLLYLLIFLLAAFWAARSFRARNDPERASLASNEGKSVQGAEKEGDNGGFCEEIIAFVANPFRFMKETSEADDRIVLAKAGLDSLIYLHILQALLTLFTVLGALGVLVLLPLNIYSARDPWVSPDSFLLSTANGFSDPSRDLLPHTFFAILTAVGMVAVVYGLRDFLATTCRMGAGGGGGGGAQPGVPPVQAYTVELQGLRCDPPVTPEQLQPLAAAAAPGQLLATSVALNVADMVDRVEKARVLRKRLARHRQQLDNDKQRPTVQTGPLRWIGLGQQEDAIMVVEKEIAEINKEIEKLRLSPDRTGTGTAFIVFRKRSAAVAFIEKFKDPENARKACGHPTIGQGRDFLCNDKSKWEAQLAAQPADIYWRNLQCSNLYRIVLSVASFAFLVVLLAFVVTPIFFVQMFLAVGDVVTDVTDGGVPANATVEDIDAAKGKMDGVAWHETLQKSQAENEGINGWIVMLLAFLSPFLVLLINGCIMPAIVHFLAKHLGQRYVSSMQRSTFDLLYFFTVLNVLILPALALEGLDQFLSVTHTVALNQLLGQVVIYGSSTSFFVDYIAQSALLGSAYFFVYHTTTPPSILKRKDSDGKEHAAWEFDFPSFYSSLLSVVAIGLVFAATVPLVLPVVVMFLAVRYYTDKWQLQTAHSTQRPDPAPESTASAVLVSILVVAALALGSFASWLFLQGAWRLAILPSLVALCLVVYVAVPYTRHRFVTVSNKWRPTKDDFPATWETEAPPDYAVAYKNPYLMEDADSTAHLRGDGASDLLSGV